MVNTERAEALYPVTSSGAMDMTKQMHEMGFAKKLSNEEFKDFVSRSLHWDAGSVEPLRTTSIGYEPLDPIKTVCYMYPELQAETTETVLVTEVNSPLRVFCQLKVFSQELKKLTEQITLHYEKTIGSSFARPENLGAPCASRGADGKWYRSVLQQVISTSNVVEVLHVDYGKKQFVQVDHVRPLAPEFSRMPVVTYVCSLHGVIDQVKPKDPLCVDMEYLHNGTCISLLKMQVECDGTLAEHEEQAGSTELLDKRNVAVGNIFSQDEDNLSSAGIEKPENYGKRISVKNTNVNTDISDIHQHSQPADVHGECHLESTDFMNKGALTGSLEHIEETRLETASPESPSCGENVCGLVSEHKDKTESGHEIIKSDLGNIRRAAEGIAVGSECVIWSHVHKCWCQARSLKISDDSTLVLLLDHDFMMMVDAMNIFEIVPEESLQAEKKKELEALTCAASQDPSVYMNGLKSLSSKVIDCHDEVDKELGAGTDLISEEQTQGKELDCLGDLVSESEKNLQEHANQCPDLDLYAPQEMSQLFIADVLCEPDIEMDKKQELVQNVCSAMVQMQTEETSIPAEEQREHVTKMCEQVDELMDIIPVMPMERDQEAASESETDLDNLGVISQEKAEESEHNAVKCFSSQEPTEIEQPTACVDVITQETEEQPQDKECGSCLGDLVADSEKLMKQDVTQGPDSGLEIPQEVSKMFVTDVSVEQSEPAMEVSSALEPAQNLSCAVKVQVQIEKDTVEMSLPVEEQEGHGPKTCEQVDELMSFISVVPLQKDQETESKDETDLDTFSVMSQEKALDVELGAYHDLAAVIKVTADVVDFVSETEQGSDATSDTIKVNVVETEHLAADTVSSDLQKSPDTEEPRASTVTDLTLRIEDTSDDDIIFVNQWQVSPTERNDPSSQD
ncbi:hypothetical protein QTP70_022514 [Hemibagrus guttatus]|uniref:Tudor domain-containing protein n=1 Tax=Hemibagrus guttatus TaxID=175788 RepID=A0AAE0UTG2_9TELE|nr:hypothetical protein QTP70_022514 [Hemibagrus guttatus]